MSIIEIKLASIVCHLIEHIETNEPTDLAAAKALIADKQVADFLTEAQSGSMLPLPRKTLVMLKDCLAES